MKVTFNIKLIYIFFVVVLLVFLYIFLSEKSNFNQSNNKPEEIFKNTTGGIKYEEIDKKIEEKNKTIVQKTQKAYNKKPNISKDSNLLNPDKDILDTFQRYCDTVRSKGKKAIVEIGNENFICRVDICELNAIPECRFSEQGLSLLQPQVSDKKPSIYRPNFDFGYEFLSKSPAFGVNFINYKGVVLGIKHTINVSDVKKSNPFVTVGYRFQIKNWKSNLLLGVGAGTSYHKLFKEFKAGIFLTVIFFEKD